MSKKKKKVARRKNSAASLGFEADLFKTADKLRGNMEPSDYKHVTLGLIFLKYISDAFRAHHAEYGLKMRNPPRIAKNTWPTTFSGCPGMSAGPFQSTVIAD